MRLSDIEIIIHLKKRIFGLDRKEVHRYLDSIQRMQSNEIAELINLIDKYTLENENLLNELVLYIQKNVLPVDRDKDLASNVVPFKKKEINRVVNELQSTADGQTVFKYTPFALTNENTSPIEDEVEAIIAAIVISDREEAEMKDQLAAEAQALAQAQLAAEAELIAQAQLAAKAEALAKAVAIARAKLTAQARLTRQTELIAKVEKPMQIEPVVKVEAVTHVDNSALNVVYTKATEQELALVVDSAQALDQALDQTLANMKQATPSYSSYLPAEPSTQSYVGERRQGNRRSSFSSHQMAAGLGFWGEIEPKLEKIAMKPALVLVPQSIKQPHKEHEVKASPVLTISTDSSNELAAAIEQHIPAVNRSAAIPSTTSENIQQENPLKSPALTDEILSIRERYIVGKKAGENLLDRYGKAIITKNSIITSEVVRKADEEGKLAELIVHMVISGYEE